MYGLHLEHERELKYGCIVSHTRKKGSAHLARKMVSRALRMYLLNWHGPLQGPSFVLPLSQKFAVLWQRW
jgi:hypothetical protein